MQRVAAWLIKHEYWDGVLYSSWILGPNYAVQGATGYGTMISRACNGGWGGHS